MSQQTDAGTSQELQCDIATSQVFWLTKPPLAERVDTFNSEAQLTELNVSRWFV